MVLILEEDLKKCKDNILKLINGSNVYDKPDTKKKDSEPDIINDKPDTKKKDTKKKDSKPNTKVKDKSDTKVKDKPDTKEDIESSASKNEPQKPLAMVNSQKH